MKKFILSTLFITMSWLNSSYGQENRSDLKLWYDKPASYWSEALPIGNGRIGAMIYGNPLNEEFQLNEETIWGGSPHNNTNPLAKDMLGSIREMIFDGKYNEAYKSCSKNIISQHAHGMPYQTVGSLNLAFEGVDNYTDLYRDLNLNNAIATTTFKSDGVTYTREAFTSFSDQVMVVKLTASEKKKISFCAKYTTPFTKNIKITTNNNGELIIDGKAADHETIEGKIKFRTISRIVNSGGKLTVTSDSTINVKDATSVTIFVSTGTNFVNYMDVSGDEKLAAAKYLKNINKNYEKSKQNHINAYQKYYNRVKLDLGKTTQSEKPTDIRLREFQTNFDPELVTIYYQYGRYLLICSSQPGGQATGLQGIWNHKLLAPWDGKYTTNINAEMNYWPSEITSLPEMHEPFIELIKEASVKGRESAAMYGCRGWTIHHNTDIWRSSGAIDMPYSGMWVSGNAWMCQDLWDRYLFSGDKDFVKEIYPIMKGACEFYIDFLVREPKNGWFVVSPSVSPENSPTINGKKRYTVHAGCTMDNQLVFDLLNNSIEAGKLVGEDSKFLDSLKNISSNLPPMQIGQYGQLQEWMDDWDDPTDKHRHVSHLWGVYPGRQISPYKSPILLDAAKTSLIHRGDPSTGWSMAWKIALWARMLDGNHAYKLIKNQFTFSSKENGRGGTYANLFCSHPPFQIDGNFGSVAGITEMFVQSHDEAINLLPALPDAWQEGSIGGIRTRGGFTVENLTWNGGKISSATISSSLGGTLRLRSTTPLFIDGKQLTETTVEECENPLLKNPEIKKPLISPVAKIESTNYPKSYLYDIKTTAGEKIVVTR